MKPKGSLTFGTSEVRTDEYILLAQVMVQSGDTPAAAAAQISFIDDCLAMLKMRSIIGTMRRTSKGFIRRNAGLAHMIDRRLEVLVEDLKDQD